MCEICEEQFTQKEDCLEHKSKHLAMYNKSLQEKRLSVEGIPKDMPQEIDGTCDFFFFFLSLHVFFLLFFSCQILKFC